MKKLFFSSLFVLSLILADTTNIYAQATMETGAMGIIVNAYGRFRAYTPNSTGTKHIERLSVLVGMDQTHVFDYLNDADTEESPALVTNPTFGDFEIYGSFNNAYSAAAPNVLAKMNVYSWNNATYALIKYTIKNRESSAFNAIVGLDVIPSLSNTYGYDSVSYNQATGVIRFYRDASANAGLKLLSHNLNSLYSFEWYSGYQVDTSYWNWMNTNSIQPLFASQVEGPVTITAQAPQNLAASDSMVVYYAFAIGANEAAMNTAMAEAVTKYQSLVNVDDENNIVETFALNQNYPNPFNPTTNISYSIPETGFVNLKVYDALGNEVATLVNDVQSQGTHSLKFDASNLTSGIYFYALRLNNQTITNKMLLMK